MNKNCRIRLVNDGFYKMRIFIYPQNIMAVTAIFVFSSAYLNDLAEQDPVYEIKSRATSIFIKLLYFSVMCDNE